MKNYSVQNVFVLIMKMKTLIDHVELIEVNFLEIVIDVVIL